MCSSLVLLLLTQRIRSVPHAVVVTHGAVCRVSGDACQHHKETIAEFIQLQEEQAQASSRGQVVHCAWPCNHGLPYNRAAWVGSTIRRFLREQAVLLDTS